MFFMTSQRMIEQARKRARRAAMRVKELEAQMETTADEDERLLERWQTSDDPQSDPYLMFVGAYEFVCATCFWRPEDIGTSVRCEELFAAYLQWCGEPVNVGRNTFYDAMDRRGFRRARQQQPAATTAGYTTVSVFPDLELKPEAMWLAPGMLRNMSLDAMMARDDGDDGAGQPSDDNAQSPS